MTIDEKFKWFSNFLSKVTLNEKTELEYTNPFELVVAVTLSAQCTDKRVNETTPNIFKKYPDAFALSLASYDELFEIIKSVSFPNNKTTHLINMAKRLVTFYGGVVPTEIEDLTSLSGVGNKSANVIRAVCFDIPALAVDTHVIRLSNRLGFVSNIKNPDQIEKILTNNIPKELWSKTHHWLIMHGRYCCKAKNPQCNSCVIAEICTIPKETKVEHYSF